jgi:hypothetical protein
MLHDFYVQFSGVGDQKFQIFAVRGEKETKKGEILVGFLFLAIYLS